MMEIRKANKKDAADVCTVIRLSIRELCVLDHHQDEDVIDHWLANKTVDNCKAWIENNRSSSFVAEQNKTVVGVSHIGHNGHLFLLYLLPEFKGQGLGAKLLAVAEQSAINLGAQSLHLETTKTAKGFYEHHGYHKARSTLSDLRYEKSIHS